MCREYNGYSNYETWNINLWLSNDEDTYHMIEDMIDDPYSSDAVYELSRGIKEYVEDSNPLGDDASMYADLLGAAISSCNFYEIAEHWIEDYRADNPQAEKRTSAEYEIDLGGRLAPREYTITLKDNGYFVKANTMLGYTEPTFWKAFNEAIDDAYTDGLSSLVVTWSVEPSVKADRLIAKQASRSSRKDA